MKPSFDIADALAAFHRHLNSIVPVPDALWRLLSEAVRAEALPAKGILLEEGAVCRHIYFIYRGAFRSIVLKEEAEVTTALHTEESCMTQMKSLASGQPSHLFIEALEDSLVLKLSKDAMVQLYARAPELEAVGRRIVEHMVSEESEWKEMYTIYSPEERYRFLLQKAPQFLQKIPLQYIASFLGIRRETLSRIRARAARMQ